MSVIIMALRTENVIIESSGFSSTKPRVYSKRLRLRDRLSPAIDRKRNKRDIMSFLSSEIGVRDFKKYSKYSFFMVFHIYDVKKYSEGESKFIPAYFFTRLYKYDHIPYLWQKRIRSIVRWNWIMFYCILQGRHFEIFAAIFRSYVAEQLDSNYLQIIHGMVSMLHITSSYLDKPIQ